MLQAYSPTIFPVVPSTTPVDGCHPLVVDSVKSYKMKKIEKKLTTISKFLLRINTLEVYQTGLKKNGSR